MQAFWRMVISVYGGLNTPKPIPCYKPLYVGQILSDCSELFCFTVPLLVLSVFVTLFVLRWVHKCMVHWICIKGHLFSWPSVEMGEKEEACFVPFIWLLIGLLSRIQLCICSHVIVKVTDSEDRPRSDHTLLFAAPTEQYETRSLNIGVSECMFIAPPTSQKPPNALALRAVSQKSSSNIF